MASSCYAIRMDLLSQETYETKLGPGRPRLAKGNDLIGFEKQSKGVCFLGTSKVIDTKDLRGEDVTIRLVTFERLTEFPEPRLLSALAGSLARVYRFLEPERHFRHRIVALTKGDFQTITEKRIDPNRSIFRYLFAALPLEMQTDFIRLNAGIMPSKAASRIEDYSALAQRIVSFFEERVRKTLELLASVPAAHAKIHAAALPSLKDLYFVSHDTKEELAFGEATVAAQRLLQSNLLFAPEHDSKPLLQECSYQLKTSLLSKEKSIFKRWNETLF